MDRASPGARSEPGQPAHRRARSREDPGRDASALGGRTLRTQAAVTGTEAPWGRSARVRSERARTRPFLWSPLATRSRAPRPRGRK